VHVRFNLLALKATSCEMCRTLAFPASAVQKSGQAAMLPSAEWRNDED